MTAFLSATSRPGALLAGVGLALLPAPASAQAPAESTVTALVERLDTAFDRGDADQYLAPFEPLHRSLHATLSTRIRKILGMGAKLRRQSRVAGLWELGDHTVALVSSATRNADRTDLGAVEEHAFWAIRGPDSDPRIVLAVEIDATHLAMIPDADDPTQPKRLFRCRACNYSIDAGDDWLMVPNCNMRIGSLESLSFYSLTHDLATDLSIHLADGDTMPSPQTMLRGLVDHALAVSPESVKIDPWLPPMYTAGSRPTYLSGARCSVDLQTEHAEVHLASYGRIGYLLVVRGPREVLDANRPDVDALMQSFALSDPKLDPDQVVLRITQEMQGGLLEGPVYSNSLHDVRFAGPTEFRPRMAASHYAFEVRWMRPDDAATIHLKALTPPAGMDRWSTDAVDRVIRNACDQTDLEICHDDGWSKGSSGFAHQRRVSAVRQRPDGLETIAIRLALADDLLVITEARAIGLSEDAVRELTGGLSRTR